MALTNRQKIIAANKHRADKIRLEASLIAALLRLLRRIASHLVSVYKENKVLSAVAYQQQFETLLLNQYKKINLKVTSKYVNADTQDEKTIDKEAFTSFKNLMLLSLIGRIVLILATTQKDINRLTNKQRTSDSPNNTTQLKIAFLAASLYRARLIGITETQNAFELKKHVISNRILQSEGHKLKKSWITIMDGKERPWHGEAFGQTVFANELFTVDGQSLMYPGDTSHGATASNICNCRCSAIYENGIFIRQMSV